MWSIDAGEGRRAWFCDDDTDALEAMATELFGGRDAVVVTEADADPPTA